MSDPHPPVQPEPFVAPPSNRLAVASLVLGIISVVLMCCVYYVAAPCGILAIIFGAVGRSRAREGAGSGGMATAGMILGMVSLLLLVAVVILAVVLGVAMLGVGSALMEQAVESGAMENASP